MGNLAGLISNTVFIEKYVDLGIPMVTITVKNFSIPKTLIDLETMEYLHTKCCH